MDAETIEVARQLGQNIRRLRRQAGLTQEAIARKCRINAKHYGEVERGNRNVSLSTLARIAKGLRVEFPQLFLFSTPAVPSGAALADTKLRALLARVEPDMKPFLWQVMEAAVRYRA
ncbi:MAG: helix-turn-helix transcriptional regulator [Planctomycetota bacterium]